MIYFIGIGGIGMSALAGIFKQLGFIVAGSDNKVSAPVEFLRAHNVRVFVPQTAENIQKVLQSNDIYFAVATTAIPKDNPEVIALKKLQIPILTYPQALGILTHILPTIGIAGTHGKTTTTAIVTQILMENGYDPYVIIGAFFDFIGGKNYRVPNHKDTRSRIFPSMNHLGKNYRVPNHKDKEINLNKLAFKKKVFLDEAVNISEIVDFSGLAYTPRGILNSTKHWLIIEADEYKNAFLNYDLQYLVLPAIEYDHLDFFKDKSNYFATFADRIILTHKAVIMNTQSPYSKQVLGKLNKTDLQDLKIINWMDNLDKVRHHTYLETRFLIEDASAAYTLASFLGIRHKQIIKSIENFKGVWRRFEILSKKSEHLPFIVSDYAHNPRKVAYALDAFANFAQKNNLHKLLIVFQPHQYYRLYSLYNEFQKNFIEIISKLFRNNFEIEFWVTDIFDARSPESHKKLVNAFEFSQDLQKELGTNIVKYTRDLNNTIGQLKKKFNDVDGILLLTAGDLDRKVREIIR